MLLTSGPDAPSSNTRAEWWSLLIVTARLEVCQDQNRPRGRLKKSSGRREPSRERNLSEGVRVPASIMCASHTSRVLVNYRVSVARFRAALSVPNGRPSRFFASTMASSPPPQASRGPFYRCSAVDIQTVRGRIQDYFPRFEVSKKALTGSESTSSR